MVADALVFSSERNYLVPEVRQEATVSAAITFVTAILYDLMKDDVQFLVG